jgi:hypothetical protein
MAASPNVLVSLLGLHGLHRATVKAQKYLAIPRIDDTKELRKEKLMKFIYLNYKSYLGCSRSEEFYLTFVMQTLAEVKTGMLEKAIKKAQQNLYDFQKEAGKLSIMVPDELDMDCQALIQRIPPVSACLYEVADMQTNMDKLRTAYWDADEDIVFNRVVRMGLDPSRALATRTHELIVASNVSLVNKYSL